MALGVCSLYGVPRARRRRGVRRGREKYVVRPALCLARRVRSVYRGLQVVLGAWDSRWRTRHSVASKWGLRVVLGAWYSVLRTER